MGTRPRTAREMKLRAVAWACSDCADGAGIVVNDSDVFIGVWVELLKAGPRYWQIEETELTETLPSPSRLCCSLRVSCSIIFLVCFIFRRLEAPNRIDPIWGYWQTYSKACCGDRAPLANTD